MFKHTLEHFLQQRIKKIPWKGVSSVFLAFLITRCMIIGVTYLSMIEIPVREGEIYWRSTPQNIIADGMVRWDSGFYRDIVVGGYQSVSEGKATVFFPLYPALVWLLYKIIGHLNLSGLLVSNLMFLVALGYLYALVHQEYKDDDIATRAVFYLAVAPSAFVFSAMYTESTFLAFLIASFYYARNSRWALAALTGAAASAARAPGIAVAVFILFEGFSQKGVRFSIAPGSIRQQFEIFWKNLRMMLSTWQSNLAAIGSTFGLWAFMLYLYKTFGDPLAFVHKQSNWGRSVTGNFLTSLFINTYNQMHFGGNLWAGEINVNLLQDVVATLVFIPLVIAVMMKMRPSYGMYSLVALLIPLMSSSVLSMRRFILMLVPCFILLAIWGKRPWFDRLVLGISLILQAYLTILFTHWYFAG